ncbi:MAG: family 43 glycosylhydrolase [Alistipes shahii]|uniref:family 43 glycosylhydrolase n=1 Tax=Alistipes shahii TaxID=328814 RepID=UPI00399D33D5
MRGGEKSSSVKIRYESSTVTSRSGEVMFSAEGVEPVKLRVTQGDKTFTNPLGGVPDPWIIQHDGWYYLCKAHGNGINLSRSKKLTELTSTQQVFAAPRDTEGNKPWNVANYWAPELHYIDGRWYIYYTAGRPTSEFGGHYYSQLQLAFCVPRAPTRSVNGRIWACSTRATTTPKASSPRWKTRSISPST